jgi:hypothetical protein
VNDAVDSLILEDVLSQISAETTVPDRAVLLPGGGVTVSESAQQIGVHLAESEELFRMDGGLYRVDCSSGTPELRYVSKEQFCSEVERHCVLHKRQKKSIEQANMSGSEAGRLYESRALQDLIPLIRGVANRPVLRLDDKSGLSIAGPGYDPVSRLYVAGDIELPDEPLPLDICGQVLSSLCRDFDFATPGDRSRFIAAVLSLAMVRSGLIGGSAPIICVGADQSQAGKTFAIRTIAGVYGEALTIVVPRKGGVGGLDESIGQALMSGKGLILLDNLRGSIDSPYLESAATANGLFPVRVPYRGEVQVDTRGTVIAVTSNGFNMTRDLANRSAMIQIRKRPDSHQFSLQDGKNIADAATDNPDLFLHAVYSILIHWHSMGRPRSENVSHDYRDWATAMDYIVHHMLNEAPLLDGHRDIQQHTTSPSSRFLRELAVAVLQQEQQDLWLTATDLCRVLHEEGVEIPGAADGEAGREHMVLGGVLGRAIGETNAIQLEDMTLERRYRSELGDRSRFTEKKEYRVRRQE